MRQSFMIALGLFFAAAESFAEEPPKLEPISSRLIGRLQYSNQGKDDNDFIVEIHFSPGGKRLIAGEYPEGIADVWDVASGKRLTTIEIGASKRGGIDFFAVSPDWKTLYAPTRSRGRKGEALQTEGRQFWRWSFDDAVQVFDLESGKLKDSWQHTPAREIRDLKLSPDGSCLVTADGVPGIYEQFYKRTYSVWSTQSRTSRTYDGRSNGWALFSPDSKQIAFVTKAGDEDDFYDKTVTIVDTSSLEPKTVIFLPPGFVMAWPCAFCCGGTVCAVRTDIYHHENDRSSMTTALRFYDVKTGAEVFQTPAPKKGESFYPVAESTDGNALAATVNVRFGDESPGQVLLVNAGSWKSQLIELGEHVGVCGLAFHPNGKWLAVTEQIGQANPPPSFVPQSQIRILDVASGKTLETLAMPPCYPQSVAFSPDGKTLATSGKGEVLLWDFSTPQGEKQP
jgi:WD40 repeat protein